MPFARCSVHDQRDAPKYASVYAAWFRSDGVRTAYKQKLCPQALREELSQILAHASDTSLDVTACPACGANSSEDLDPIYLNVYLPKQEARVYELPTCASCAAILRVQLQRGAEKLPDRQDTMAEARQAVDEAWSFLP